jgi:hypothetical protein
MKNLIVGSLIALAASQAAGCIITSGDDSEDAHVSATWALKDLRTNTRTGCPAGFDTAALFNQALDGNNNPIGSCSTAGDNNGVTCFVDLFDCVAGAGVSYPLPPTRYKSWVQIMDHPAASLYASSVPAYVDITDVDQNLGVEILNDGGYFQLSWLLVDAQSNAPLSCSEANAAGVETIASLVTTPTEMVIDQFDCGDRFGVTAGLLAADYTVSIGAINASEQDIGERQVVNRATIGDRNRVTDLGDFMLPID